MSNYIDRKGEIVLTVSDKNIAGSASDDLDRHSNGLIRMRERKKIGYMDQTGKVVIKPQFSFGGAFSEGLARVEINGEKGYGKLAYIDTSGKIVIPPRFNTDSDLERNSTDFSGGIACLREGLQRSITKTEWVCIDKTGKVILETNLWVPYGFFEGLAAAQDAGGGKWGVIDITGKVVVPFKYAHIGDFSEGLAVVSL